MKKMLFISTLLSSTLLNAATEDGLLGTAGLHVSDPLLPAPQQIHPANGCAQSLSAQETVYALYNISPSHSTRTGLTEDFLAVSPGLSSVTSHSATSHDGDTIMFFLLSPDDMRRSEPGTHHSSVSTTPAPYDLSTTIEDIDKNIREQGWKMYNSALKQAFCKLVDEGQLSFNQLPKDLQKLLKGAELTQAFCKLVDEGQLSFDQLPKDLQELLKGADREVYQHDDGLDVGAWRRQLSLGPTELLNYSPEGRKTLNAAANRKPAPMRTTRPGRLSDEGDNL